MFSTSISCAYIVIYQSNTKDNASYCHHLVHIVVYDFHSKFSIFCSKTTRETENKQECFNSNL